MLRDLGSNYHVYIACGYTDLRLGVDGLTRIVKNNFDKNPYDESNIYLFCGRRTDRIKALVYEGDGFVLLYKRLVRGRYQWPRYVFCKYKIPKVAGKNGESCISILEKVADMSPAA